MKAVVWTALILLPIASGARADDEVPETNFIQEGWGISTLDAQLRIEAGIYYHVFDSALKLEADPGPYVQVSFRIFERLWAYGELRHVDTNPEVPGPNPDGPVTDVDTWLVGLAGHRPLFADTQFVLQLAAGEQWYDVVGGAEQEEPVWVAGMSVVHGPDHFFLRFGVEVEYLRTTLNQPGGEKETILNYVALVSLGVQF